MQVNNNYQPTFRAGKITNSGLKVLSNRLPSGQFQKFVDRFVQRHKGSDYQITLGAGVNIKNRLDAMIDYGNKNFRYIEEGILSSLLTSPKRFMNKINRQIDKDVLSIAERGYLI